MNGDITMKSERRVYRVARIKERTGMSFRDWIRHVFVPPVPVEIRGKLRRIVTNRRGYLCEASRYLDPVHYLVSLP